VFQTLIESMLDSKLRDKNERGRAKTIYTKEYEVQMALHEISSMLCLPKPRPQFGGLKRQLDEGIGKEGVPVETRL
jgi:hypothetical protein